MYKGCVAVNSGGHLSTFIETPVSIRYRKMDAEGPSETLVCLCRTTWCHIPPDNVVRSHRCEKLKSHIIYVILDQKFYTVRALNLIRFR